MADIQLNTFEKQRFYQVDNTLAHILVALGLAGAIQKDQSQTRGDTPPPAAPTFSVVLGQRGHVLMMLHLPTGERRYFGNEIPLYDLEHPKAYENKFRDAFKAPAWSGMEQRHVLQGPEPSKELFNEYVQARRKADAVSKDAAELARDNEAKRAAKGSIPI
jgi:hypothetical protein